VVEQAEVDLLVQQLAVPAPQMVVQEEVVQAAAAVELEIQME
jgi:hypothetical protein